MTKEELTKYFRKRSLDIEEGLMCDVFKLCDDYSDDKTFEEQYWSYKVVDYIKSNKPDLYSRLYKYAKEDDDIKTEEDIKNQILEYVDCCDHFTEDDPLNSLLLDAWAEWLLLPENSDRLKKLLDEENE